MGGGLLIGLRVTLATICTGLATGVGALPILFMRNVSDRLLDAMLGFAPETHRKGFEHKGSWGVMIGFVVMMLAVFLIHTSPPSALLPA